LFKPLLFNLYIKDIIKIIPYNCKLIQFADDIAILCQDKDINRVYSCLGNTFNEINTWLGIKGLELSIPKTQFIIFHRSNNLTFPENISVDGGCIQRLKFFKYLGMTMDSEMRWTEHIRTLKIKTAKYTNILKWLSGRSWGIDPVQALNFINATIVAQLM